MNARAIVVVGLSGLLGAACSSNHAGPAATTAASCATSGAGLDDCGANHESCCKSLVVSGGTFDRTYTAADDGSATPGSDPATVSDFKLDVYDVTVGRFRQFVAAARSADGGVGWRPAAGDGKHTHLGAQGLASVGASADAGAANEPGWSSADDDKVAPTDTNLTYCGPTSTWTATPGAHENLPMNCVTWYEAYAFCIWDGGFLPTEAEWEYAAAGGDQQRLYPWGATDPGTTDGYAIYDCHWPVGAQSCTDVASLAPVGSAAMGAGRWGQVDLAGNVWQWTLDWFNPSFVTPCNDCAALGAGSSRNVHGGAFDDTAAHIQPSFRDANNPSLRTEHIGIRCARSP